MIEGPITKGTDLDPMDHLKVIKALINVMESTTEKPHDSDEQLIAQLAVSQSLGEIASQEMDALADKMGYVWKDGDRRTLEKRLAVVIDLFGPDSGRHRSHKK